MDTPVPRPARSTAGRLRFGRFELQPLEGRLLVDGEPAPLGGRAFELLCVLAERAGSLVTRNELIERVWPHVVVEENNLSVQINALRRVLGADVVVTVPGRGYRLAARVEADASAAPAAPPAAAPRTHLPVGLPPLFGRDDDLAALGALLDGHRLVTVVGAGGVGKSRLAQALLLRRAPREPGGVCWVDLQAAGDAADLAGAVATALGLLRAPGEPVASLVQAAAGLQALVALDGAESRLDAVAALAQALLDGVAGLRLLVTSQAPLRLPAERVLRLAPLALPPAGDAATRGQGAIALFEDRARAADSRFTLDDAQLPVVAEICRRLDGLPLAIELAAARAPVLGVPALRDALDDRLRLLTASRNRLAPPRQRTLRAALEWSHGLLAPLEQALFRRLGVVAGRAPLSLVQALMDDGAEADRWALLDALDQLVQRSLVEAASDESWAAPRYRLLESPRALALEQLAAAGEVDRARRRHAQAVLAEFERGERALLAGETGVVAWRRDGEPLFADARQALDWARAAGEPALALALALALLERVPDPRHAETAPAVRACEELLDPGDDVPPLQACKAWLRLDVVGFFGPQRRIDATHRALERANRLGDGDDERFVRYAVHCEAARTLAAHRQVAEAEALLAVARALEDRRWSPLRRRTAARAEAFLAMAQGRAGAALERLREVLRLGLEAGDPSPATRLNIADMELLAGDVRSAVANGRALVAELEQARAYGLLLLARINLAVALLAQDDTAAAAPLLRAAWDALARFGRDWPHRDGCLGAMALLAALQGRLDAAARLLGAALREDRGAKSAPDGNDARALRRCEGLLASVAAERLEALRREGAALDDAAIAAIAFADAF